MNKQSKQKIEKITPQELAAQFHLYYELYAHQYGYETREDTKELDFDSPNGKLMIKVCEKIIYYINQNK